MKGQHLESAFLWQIKILFFCLVSNFCFAQKTLIVVDSTGDVLPGVECFNKDYSFAMVSDVNGKIVIPGEFGNDTVSLKYLGFETVSLNLQDLSVLAYVVKMKTGQKLLEEIIMIGRSDIRATEFLQKVDAVNSIDISSSNSQTTVDALSQHADVYVQKSQMGGGSPVIRGFEANKVLLVVDGIRMNNAIYRNGHLQNSITIDQAILDQMEVIYGASSLMYGSDALGGVIHFRTKDPVLKLSNYEKSRVFGNYYMRYSTANKEKSGHFDINFGKRSWASLTSISFSDFGDQRMGSRRTKEYPDFGKRSTYQSRIGQEDVILNNENPNIQIGTSYNQFDLLQKVKFQINPNMNLTANIQFSKSSDIPRYDQLILKDNSIFQFGEWNYGPQQRALFSLKYKWTENLKFMDEIVVIASRQDIIESRIERQFGSDIRIKGKENVGVNSLTLDLHKKIIRNHTHLYYYGFDLNHNDVQSAIQNENILTGAIDNMQFTRYPSGGSTMDLLGGYFQYVNQAADTSIVLHTGVRYSYFNTFVKYSQSDPIQWPDYFYDGVQSTNDALTWSAGLNWRASKKLTIRMLTSTAFRAPNVDDIGKFRINNNDVSVPNTTLGAEKSINGELDISKKLGKNILISASTFYTRLTNAIIRRDYFLPDGRTSFTDGNRTYNVQSNINAGKAEIYGVSGNIKMNIMRNLRLLSSLSYLKGNVVDEKKLPLDHIPPLYGKTQLKFNHKKWDFTFLSLYNASKPLDLYGGSADNPEYATPEGALGWAVFNIYADYTFKSFTFQFGIENIFDKHYRTFSSGVSSPGINGIFAVRGKF